jgi:hypothetical protein
VPFFTAAPLVAAPLSSLRTTVLTGLASFLAVYAVHARFGYVPDADAVTELTTVATVSALAAGINRVVRRGDQRLASAREVAEAAQRAVLPEPAERIGGFEIAARYEAAQEGTLVGGDLYAVQDTPYGVWLVVGDVRGKGRGAVAAVAVVLGAFREAAEQEASLEAVAWGSPGSSEAENWGRRLERRWPARASGAAASTRSRGSPPPCSPNSRTARARSGSSTGAIRRCCCTPTARCARSRCPRPRCRWGWASWAPGRTGPPSGRSRAGPRCCCTPTASPRPGTRTAGSSTRSGGRMADDMALLVVRRT